MSMIIGLTGPTGAGKTTVANCFKSMNVAVIDADFVSRSIIDTDKSILQKLIDEFGRDIVDENGRLIRKLLASRAFSSKTLTEKLNAIMLPAILSEIENLIYELSLNGQKLIVLDAPLLFESGANNLCDIVISVVASYDTRMKRILKRDLITADMAKKRMLVQKDTEFYLNNSDFILDGERDISELLDDAKQLILEIRKKIDCE